MPVPPAINASKPERADGFWDRVTAFVMRGQLASARDLLARHSEIAAALSVEPGSAAERAMAGILGGITRAQCEELLALFDSHPFAVLLRDLSRPNPFSSELDFNTYETALRRLETASAQQIGVDLLAFAERAQNLQRAQSPLLLRNPSLGRALRVLQGDRAALQHEARGDWRVLSLAQLLYCRPPGLSRHNVADLVATAAADVGGSSEALETLGLTKEALRGHITPLLMRLHSLQRQAHETLPAVYAVSLLQALTHMCLLLSASQTHPELTAPLPHHDDGLSFAQELCLQTAQALVQPGVAAGAKLCVFYLRHLPDALAAPLIDTLLVVRHYRCDAELEEAADVLRALGRDAAAADLLALRAAALLRPSQLATRRAAGGVAQVFAERHQRRRAQAARAGAECAATSGRVAQSARWLAQAGRFVSLRRLLAATLGDLATALRCCDAITTALALKLKLPAVSLHLEDLATAGAPSAADRATLLLTLDVAQAVVDAVLRPLTAAADDAASSGARRELVALDGYSRVLRALLDFEKQRNTAGGAVVDCSSAPLREAADSAASVAWLLRPKLTQSAAAMDASDTDEESADGDADECPGVALHCVELAAALHAGTAHHEAQQSLSVAFLQRLEERVAGGEAVDDVLPRGWCQGALTLQQARRLCRLSSALRSALSPSDVSTATSERALSLLHELHARVEGVFVSASHADAQNQLQSRSRHREAAPAAEEPAVSRYLQLRFASA